MATNFSFDLEKELGNIARRGGTPLPSADPKWLVPRMEKFEEWCKAEIGRGPVAPNNLMMLAHNIHIYLLQQLAEGFPRDMRPLIREAAVTVFVDSMLQRTEFK